LLANTEKLYYLCTENAFRIICSYVRTAC